MRRSLLLLLLTVAANAAANTPPIRLQLSPKVGTSPQDVHLKVFVERAPANRWLVLLVDGPNYSWTSTIQLDGDAAPRVFDLWRKQLPCGDYTVAVVVKRNDDTSSQVADHLRLLGMGCSTPDDPF